MTTEKKSARAFKAIFFDFDGVMAETMPFHLQAWEKVIEGEYGFSFDPMTVMLNEGRPAVDIAERVFAAAGKAASRDELHRVVEKKNAIFRATIKNPVYPENIVILSLSREKGMKTGLVTGTRLENVHALLPQSVIENLDIIIVDGDTERGKPHPDPYLTASRRVGVAPDHCLVVENAPMGIAAAKKAGMFCVAIKSTLSEEHLQDADVIFENHAELLKYITGLE